jgi:hypothetical protein
VIEWAIGAAVRAESFDVRALEAMKAGAEHSAFYDRVSKRVIKVTHSGSFGWSPAAEGLKATPLEYLDRLEWQNYLFSDEIKIVAVVGDKRVRESFRS